MVCIKNLHAGVILKYSHMCVHNDFSYELLPTGVVVGFKQSSYAVSESVRTATLTVMVISGTLQTQVSTVFSTSPGTAVGKLVDEGFF